MPIKTTVREFLAFYRDAWPKLLPGDIAWHADETLHVGDIFFDTTERDIIEEFEKLHPLTEVTLDGGSINIEYCDAELVESLEPWVRNAVMHPSGCGFQELFLAWRERERQSSEKIAVFCVEIPEDKRAEFAVFLSTINGKVLA